MENHNFKYFDPAWCVEGQAKSYNMWRHTPVWEEGSKVDLLRTSGMWIYFWF